MTTPHTSGAADLRTAAQAVVDRWDTPLWKDVPATAEYIGRLRAALAAGQATAAPAQPAAQRGVAYAALPDLSDANGEIWRAIIYWGHAKRGEDALRKASELERVLSDQMRAFADATHTLRASHGQAPAQTADSQLLQFYGVTTDAELIAAQAAHIEKLQAKLTKTPSFAPQRVREG